MARNAPIINQILELFKQSFDQLKVEVRMNDLERLAILIDESMSSEARQFHDPRHVFEIVKAEDPIQNLAALFHDIVYYQVDKGFPPGADKFLRSCVRVLTDGLTIRDEIQTAHPETKLALAVFDFHGGEKLNPLNGQNEFLSALVAQHYLKFYLAPGDLMAVLAAIEATIPFRSPVEGLAPMVRLQKRLQKINREHKLGLNEPRLLGIMKMAVRVANQDVSSFAEPDTASFLVKTWRLIPETNERLRRELYTIRDYRLGLLKMYGFFNAIDYRTVFQNYDNCVPTEELTVLEQHAKLNIELSRSYLEAKLISVSILEALAEMTGGDLPLSMLLGDVRRRNEDKVRMEDFLPPLILQKVVNPNVLRILEQGRAMESSFDMKNSPLAAYVYKSLGAQKIEGLIFEMQAFFAGKTPPKKYLSHFDSGLVSVLAKSCAKVCISRRDQLLAAS